MVVSLSFASACRICIRHVRSVRSFSSAARCRPSRSFRPYLAIRDRAATVAASTSRGISSTVAAASRYARSAVAAATASGRSSAELARRCSARASRPPVISRSMRHRSRGGTGRIFSDASIAWRNRVAACCPSSGSNRSIAVAIMPSRVAAPPEPSRAVARNCLASAISSAGTGVARTCLMRPAYCFATSLRAAVTCSSVIPAATLAPARSATTTHSVRILPTSFPCVRLPRKPPPHIYGSIREIFPRADPDVKRGVPPIRQLPSDGGAVGDLRQGVGQTH